MSVCLTLATLATACGDDSGGGPAGPNGPDTTSGELTAVRRAAAIEAVEGKAQELWDQGVTGAAFNQAMVQLLQSRAEFEAAGVDEGTSTVWGHFDDGRLLLVVNNRFPEPPPAAAAAAAVAARSIGWRPLFQTAAATELPVPTRARLLHAMGGGFAQLQAPIMDMVPWLAAAGYGVAAGAEGDAHVTTLRSLTAEGFFYFNTHGGAGPTPKSLKDTLFAMWTTTIRDSVTDKLPDIKDDLDNHRLIYMTAPTGVWVRNSPTDTTWRQVTETHYAITHHFVERYMSFGGPGANSVLYFSVCHSAGPKAADFIAATHAKGAGVYFGWTDVVDDATSFPAVRYLVDRLLGANQYRPESPHQRPFPWPDVLEDMRQKGLTTVPANGATLVARPGPATGPQVGLLAPSVQYLAADETNNVLHIYGIFGTDPGAQERTVTIDDGVDGATLTVQSWTPTEIVAQLPAVGPGSKGDVIVTVRGHPSNPRQLLAWQGTVTYTLDDLGSLSHEIEMELNVRADPASMRTLPGETPGQGVPSVMGSTLATARYALSGSYTEVEDGCTTRYSWDHSGTLTDWDPGAGDILGYKHFALVDARPGQAKLMLSIWLDAPYATTAVMTCDDGTTNTYTIPGRFSLPLELMTNNRLEIPLDASLNAAPGQVSGTVESRRDGSMSATATLAWSAMTATPVHDPSLPR